MPPASAPLRPEIALIDSHCHLDMSRFDADREAVIERARAAGVAAMVTIGAGGPLECNDKAVQLAVRETDIFATVGIHPHDASAATTATFNRVEQLACSPEVVAIGETGLDFHYDNSPRRAQEDAFRRFVHLARRLSLPLVIHLRDAYERAAAILEEEKAGEVGGVIHCFSGNAAAARLFLDLGFHLSFSGVVTFAAAEGIRQAARFVPDDRLLVETDAPFLAPVPVRGKRNEPAFVRHTAACIASVRNVPLAALAATTTANARRVFRLSA